MPMNLLPASAQAFAPRSAPTIVLNSKVEPWLTQTLKRISKIKRPLNNVPQHFRCLTETLSAESAIWNLCSIMLPQKPSVDLVRDSNPLVDAMFNYQMLHIEAYVVHVDMISQHEVAFKLTVDTIDALVEYHRDVWSHDMAANTWDWPEKAIQMNKLQNEFFQAVNRFVYRTADEALEGLEEDGAGELVESRSEDVKQALMGLFHPLLPPPPRTVDVVRPAPALPNSYAGDWWQSSQSCTPTISAPMNSWRVLSPTPSPTPASTMPMDGYLPSPAPSSSQLSQLSQPFCEAELYYSPPQSVVTIDLPISISSLPFPSLLIPCGSTANGGFGGSPWTFNEYAPLYASAV